jgi:hypothetical protein
MDERSTDSGAGAIVNVHAGLSRQELLPPPHAYRRSPLRATLARLIPGWLVSRTGSTAPSEDLASVGSPARQERYQRLL